MKFHGQINKHVVIPFNVLFFAKILIQIVLKFIFFLNLNLNQVAYLNQPKVQAGILTSLAGSVVGQI